MATPEQEAHMREIGRHIEAVLASIYGKHMGFFLVVSPFEEKDTIADYIGNADRESAAKWMRETAKMLESDKVIPHTKGNA